MPETTTAPPPHPDASPTIAQLRNDPVPLTLADGSTVGIKLTFAAIAHLENVYGSHYDVIATLEGDATRKTFNDVATIFTACLQAQGAMHELRIFDEKLNTVTVETVPWTRDAVMAVLDPRELRTYAEVIEAAARQAFPQPEPGGGAGNADAQ